MGLKKHFKHTAKCALYNSATLGLPWVPSHYIDWGLGKKEKSRAPPFHLLATFTLVLVTPLPLPPTSLELVTSSLYYKTIKGVLASISPLNPFLLLKGLD